MPVETTVCILSGLVIAFVSGTIGKYIGTNGKVHEDTCEERRLSCTRIIGEKIDSLTKSIDRLEKTVNNKIV